MTLPAVLRVTADEYRAMPEGGPHYQLIEGELFMSPAPNRYHQEISGRLEFLLRKYLEQHPIGKLYDAPFDVYLTEHNVFQPDIVFVSKDRASILTEAGAEGAPDLVVEILSPRTSHLDRDSKRKVYAASGVAELWLIDPSDKMIEVYRLQEDPEHPATICSENESFTSPTFRGLTLHAAKIFND